MPAGRGARTSTRFPVRRCCGWNLAASPSVPADVKTRFQKREGGRITNTGDILITSQRFRDQERNRQDCLEKLTLLLRAAAVAPRRRKITRPTRGSIEARLRDKKQRSGAKAARKQQSRDE